MIRSFRDRRAAALFTGRRVKGLDPAIQRRALDRLLRLDRAKSLAELAAVPGHRLERLAGDRAGQYSLRINEQWRLCFRWQDGDAHEVEIVDYH